MKTMTSILASSLFMNLFPPKIEGVCEPSPVFGNEVKRTCQLRIYKTCCAGPFALKVSSVPNTDIQQPILSPEHIPSTSILASEEINKQCKMARGQVSHGQLSKI